MVGRCSTFSIFGLFNPLSILGGDYIIIKGDRIGIKHALESKPKKIFKVHEIEKILLVKRTVSSWSSSGKIDIWEKNGIEMEISLLLNSGEKYVLIPKFFLWYGKKDWDWFLNELCNSTDLPLEEIIETSKKK